MRQTLFFFWRKNIFETNYYSKQGFYIHITSKGSLTKHVEVRSHFFSRQSNTHNMVMRLNQKTNVEYNNCELLILLLSLWDTLAWKTNKQTDGQTVRQMRLSPCSTAGFAGFCRKMVLNERCFKFLASKLIPADLPCVFKAHFRCPGYNSITDRDFAQQGREKPFWELRRWLSTEMINPVNLKRARATWAGLFSVKCCRQLFWTTGSHKIIETSDYQRMFEQRTHLTQLNIIFKLTKDNHHSFF